MKKILLTLAFVLPLSLAVQGAKPAAAAADSTAEVEVYSDTTSIDSVQTIDSWDDFDDDWDDWEEADANSIMNGMGIGGSDLLEAMGGMLMVVAILFILFVLAPVALIGIILYFVYKNRKERLRLMEAALKSGKQIPPSMMGTPYTRNEALWNKGVTQVFFGVGLAILLWVILGKLGIAIGAFIALIGVGNMVIGYGAKKKQKEMEEQERMQDSDKPAANDNI